MNMKKNNTWFVSDTHFHHRPMVAGFGTTPEYRKEHSIEIQRPWATIEEHNEAIVENWNSVVGVNDTVYHLGDVILGNKNESLTDEDFAILGRLNGKIKLVIGNHDTPAKRKRYEPYIQREEAYMKLGDSIMISHVPIHSCELDTRFKYNIHGHLHGDVVDDPRYFSVCLEQINYTPIHIDEVFRLLKERNNT